MNKERIAMDREKVIKEWEAVLSRDPLDAPWDLIDDTLTLLKEQETVEPKTGKWERHYSRPGVYADLFWWCSCCGEPTRYSDAGIFYQYCPKCGAKLEPCREE